MHLTPSQGRDSEDQARVESDGVALSQVVLEGLQKSRKELPCTLLYDERGSQLFDQICDLEEYYPTRTEMAIMRRHIREITDCVDPKALMIEYGSGSSLKTRLLLDHLPDLAGYVPIDISTEHLQQSAAQISAAYPHLHVSPVSADFRDPIELPPSCRAIAHRVAYFPGSTIGNFHADEAAEFLERVADLCGPLGGLLIGVDLKKDPTVLHQAYNDQKGVTAAFNLNILVYLNRELGTDFQLDQFRHYAFYNTSAGRIEMHLVSLADQVVHLDDQIIEFKEGESIWTESSYKYTLEAFEALAAGAGFQVNRVWTDADKLFSIQHLTVTARM